MRRLPAPAVAAADLAAPAAPWAFDLPAAEFPARALDPILSIGAVEVTAYRYLPGGVLRFTVADTAMKAGAEVSVQYGRNVATRRVLTTALVLEVTP